MDIALIKDLPLWLQVIMQGLMGLGIVFATVYGVMRKINADTKNDIVDDKTQKIMDSLNNQLESERSANTHLRDVIERVATERNQAMQNVGKLEGHVQALESQVEQLRREIITLESENKKLSKTVDDMRLQMIEFGNLLMGLNK